ncbi:hypothetical protein [Bradyrhizobium sp. LA7.1]|uniref:hypothetical protein n=1 Tax=Bradyrhizobium sp. LA7.1 TaxID=3156324 RepID=UPI00339B3143
MPIRKKSGSSKRVSAKFVIGRERFAQISAVEGIKLTGEMKARSARFEREGLSPAQRRKEIIKAYKKG